MFIEDAKLCQKSQLKGKVQPQELTPKKEKKEKKEKIDKKDKKKEKITKKDTKDLNKTSPVEHKAHEDSKQELIVNGHIIHKHKKLTPKDDFKIQPKRDMLIENIQIDK